MKITPKTLNIFLFAMIIFGIPLATLVAPKQTRSENENRILARAPSIIDKNKAENAENFADILGAVRWEYLTARKDNFMEDIENYFSDHIVLREAWVVGANTLDRLSGKRTINGVYTKNDQMIQIFDDYDEEAVARSLSAMDAFAAKYRNIPSYFMLAPTVQETREIPFYLDCVNETEFIENCFGKLENIAKIDCADALKKHSDEYIFYRTDHHWTSLGAYYAYVSAAEILGYVPYCPDDLEIEHASADFRGTLFSKTLDSAVTPDVIDYYFLKTGEPKIKMTVNKNGSSEVYDSIYLREFLEKKDKYSSFTGENAPVVTIETDVKNGKKLLIIKDSYAHSLVPFLSKHYEKITMVDMRYINSGLNSFVRIKDYSQILFMFNAMTFSEDKDLVKLRLTR